MPYRAGDGFSWYTTDDAMRARRVAAALVLVAAGWATGFFAGRMSAWVFPVTDTNTAALTAVLDKTPQHFAPNPPRAEPPAPRVEDKQALAAKQPEPPAAPAPSEQSQPDVTVLNKNASQQPGPQAGDDKRIAVAPDEGDRVEALQNDARVAATNAGRAASDRRANQPDDDRRVSAVDEGHGFDAAGVAECESRYSSFRRSDGTYQPYGRSSRQVCPFLR